MLLKPGTQSSQVYDLTNKVIKLHNDISISIYYYICHTAIYNKKIKDVQYQYGHHPRITNPFRTVTGSKYWLCRWGYLLHSSLCGCVWRLGVSQELQDLLEALFIRLPLHPTQTTQDKQLHSPSSCLHKILPHIKRLQQLWLQNNFLNFVVYVLLQSNVVHYYHFVFYALHCHIVEDNRRPW